MNVLSVKDLGINFGGLRAVDRFSMEIEEGQLAGLIGPNGAGKTTVFNMLTGVYEPSDGTIELQGKSLLRKKPNAIVKMGVARTFQNIRLFKNMSVLDNVKVALHNSKNYNLLDAFCHTSRYFRQEKEMDEKAIELLKVFHLDEYKDVKAANLPYGKQRELEIARALATDPKLLLLDEPAAGMNPQETENLMNTIRFVRDHFKISILLIEHDMKLVMGICEKITVLNYGMVLASGTPDEIRRNPAVIKAYLGD